MLLLVVINKCEPKKIIKVSFSKTDKFLLFSLELRAIFLFFGFTISVSVRKTCRILWTHNFLLFFFIIFDEISKIFINNFLFTNKVIWLNYKFFGCAVWCDVRHVNFKKKKWLKFCLANLHRSLTDEKNSIQTWLDTHKIQYWVWYALFDCQE